MNNFLSPFPVLNDKRIEKLCYRTTEYSFFYNKENKKVTIEKKKNDLNDSCYILRATEGDDWNHDDYELRLVRSIKLSNLETLFGCSGIACSTASIGIAILWTSSDSRQRGVIQVGEFTKKDDDKEFDIEYVFEKGTLRGSIFLKTIFFIKSVGRPLSNETFLANTYGCILGELDTIEVILDGNGSVFPIMNEENGSGPLWRIICDWIDPTEDKFDDCVRIMLNTQHKFYRLIEEENGNTLLIEIIANAMTILISKLQNSSFWNNAVSGTGFSAGSICDAVNYFVNTLEWDPSTPEKLSETIRTSLEGKLYHGI